MRYPRGLKAVILGLKNAFLGAVVLSVIAVPCQSQQRQGRGNIVPEWRTSFPWPQGMEEFAFPTLPAGGWNVPGAYSARSTAMGETVLSGPGPAAGILNPSYLTRLSRPMISLNYRYTAHSYKTLPGLPLFNMSVREESEPSSFKRRVGYPDGAGLALPLGRWSFAADYSLHQEYNIPDASASFFSIPSKVKQSGETRRINVGIANSLTARFSVGISASYLYGRISRFEVSPIYAILRDRNPRELLEDLRKLVRNSLFPGLVQTENTEIDLTGFLVNLGATYQWKENMLVGISLRAPFTLSLEASVSRLFPGGKMPEERFSGKINLDQPFVATGSLLYLPTTSFSIAADLSYWNWKGCRTDGSFRRMVPNGFENILKLNLGAEYSVSLPFPVIKTLALRAGYIHDPQPYRMSESFIRDFATAGIALEIGRFRFDAAAKIQLFDTDPGRFDTDVFSVGLSCEF